MDGEHTADDHHEDGQDEGDDAQHVQVCHHSVVIGISEEEGAARHSPHELHLRVLPEMEPEGCEELESTVDPDQADAGLHNVPGEGPEEVVGAGAAEQDYQEYAESWRHIPEVAPRRAPHPLSEHEPFSTSAEEGDPYIQDGCAGCRVGDGDDAVERVGEVRLAGEEEEEGDKVAKETGQEADDADYSIGIVQAGYVGVGGREGRGVRSRVHMRLQTVHTGRKRLELVMIPVGILLYG